MVTTVNINCCTAVCFFCNINIKQTDSFCSCYCNSVFAACNIKLSKRHAAGQIVKYSCKYRVSVMSITELQFFNFITVDFSPCKTIPVAVIVITEHFATEVYIKMNKLKTMLGIENTHRIFHMFCRQICNCCYINTICCFCNCNNVCHEILFKNILCNFCNNIIYSTDCSFIFTADELKTVSHCNSLNNFILIHCQKSVLYGFNRIDQFSYKRFTQNKERSLEVTVRNMVKNTIGVIFCDNTCRNLKCCTKVTHDTVNNKLLNICAYKSVKVCLFNFAPSYVKCICLIHFNSMSINIKVCLVCICAGENNIVHYNKLCKLTEEVHKLT